MIWCAGRWPKMSVWETLRLAAIVPGGNASGGEDSGAADAGVRRTADCGECV